jgi:hypothetical protein
MFSVDSRDIDFVIYFQAVIAEKEHKNADIYYEMYRKGQESAKFERNFEVKKYFCSS